MLFQQPVTMTSECAAHGKISARSCLSLKTPAPPGAKCSRVYLLQGSLSHTEKKCSSYSVEVFAFHYCFCPGSSGNLTKKPHVLHSPLMFLIVCLNNFSSHQDMNSRKHLSKFSCCSYQQRAMQIKLRDMKHLPTKKSYPFIGITAQSILDSERDL